MKHAEEYYRGEVLSKRELLDQDERLMLSPHKRAVVQTHPVLMQSSDPVDGNLSPPLVLAPTAVHQSRHVAV